MLSLSWGKRRFFIFTKSTQRNHESVSMATCWQACVMEAWGWPPAECATGRGGIACPFINEVVGIEADIIQSQLSQERLIRLHVDVLSFPEEYLYGRYCFTSRSIIYLTISSAHTWVSCFMDVHCHLSKFIPLPSDHLPVAIIISEIPNPLVKQQFVGPQLSSRWLQ